MQSECGKIGAFAAARVHFHLDKATIGAVASKCGTPAHCSYNYHHKNYIAVLEVGVVVSRVLGIYAGIVADAVKQTAVYVLLE